MKDLHILWLGRNDTGRMQSAMTYFRLELAKQARVTFNGKDYPLYKRDMPKLVKEHDIDIIIIRGQTGKWVGLEDLSIPKVLIRGDPHALLKETTSWVKKRGIGASCHLIYGEPGLRGVHPWKKLVDPDHRTMHLPFSVPLEKYYDYKFDREYDVSILGRIGHRTYPTRTAIAEAAINPDNGFKPFRKQRPGTSWGYKDAKETLEKYDVVVFEEYIKAIARCKMMAVGASVYKYAVAKFFECMGVGTLALSDSPSDADRLHFKPGWNFVEVNLGNVAEKMRYYLENEGERKKIARRGYRTVRRYHTCQVRATQLLEFLEQL
jgi:glycosyltransferase involved in cell wall biosynthesis